VELKEIYFPFIGRLISWEGLADILYRLIEEQLRPQCIPSLSILTRKRQHYASALAEADQRCQPEIYQVIDAFCETACVPDMTPVTRLILALRAQHGYELAHTFAFGHRPPRTRLVREPRPPATTEWLLRWLLISVWQEDGLEATQRMVELLHGIEHPDSPRDEALN
jgi:hypothetical protein